mmetsp:Transcript_19999/g.46042  ORF Transcript_19999/g.46042 Transcript_19999/m.46042 type:complete len:127 (+) Transcript_19999:73-453(+)
MAALLQRSVRPLTQAARSITIMAGSKQATGKAEASIRSTSLLQRAGGGNSKAERRSSVDVSRAASGYSFPTAAEVLQMGDLGYAPITQAGRLRMPLLGLDVSRTASRHASLLGGKASPADDFNPML